MKEHYSFWKMLKGVLSWKKELLYIAVLSVIILLILPLTTNALELPISSAVIAWSVITGFYAVVWFTIRTSLKLIYITLLWTVLNSSECDEKMVEYYKEIVG